jgi:YidC/Oxa1 family membrane protein insertase
MEKRQLFLFIAIAISFLLINFFTQHQNQDQLRKWQETQKVKKVKKIHDIEQDIVTRQAKASDLPLVEIYLDQKGTQFFSMGILDKSAIITLSKNDQDPQNVFCKPLNSSQPLQEYYVTYEGKSTGNLLVYRHGLPEPLLIGNLPDFGKYELQILTLDPLHREKPYAIAVADYTDGHLTVPAEQLHKLKLDLSNEKPLLQEPVLSNGIILFKTSQGYLPIALYDGATITAKYLKDISGLETQFVTRELTTSEVADQTEEKFYVLENDYQQLVFSNVGGALAEINLPFRSTSNQQSVVRSIEFDREMESSHPYNDHFPSHAYSTPSDKPEGPFTEHIAGKLGGYYPLIRRDLIEQRNRKSIKVEPRYYALNIVSEYPEVAELVYQVKQFSKNTIVFEAEQTHRKITKTYSIATEQKGAPYCVDVTIKMEGDSRGLWLTTGIPEVELISGSPAPSLKYRITRQGKAEVNTVDLPSDAITNTSFYPDWICNSNGFLGMILNPLTEIDSGFRANVISGTVVPTRLVEIDQQYERFKAQDLPGYLMLLPLKKQGGTMKFHFFAGPFADDILKEVDNFYSDPSIGYNPDFIAAQTFHGWFAFISEPFADFLFILMKFFQQITGSWAISIILLTVALRLMLYPLNAWSMKSMAKMQQIAPEITAIQEKYKKDPKKVQTEIMNLYRERKINPVSGCLPLLIQMPFLIGMFDLLKSTFELRGAPFIPGWIDNLTAPDVLFSWKTPIFFIGNQFHLLPILLGAVMFIQQRMSSKLPKDSSLWTEQQRQQRVMGVVMTVVFTVMFYNFPSGLNIYWLSSMLLGILQQWWTQKNLGKRETTKNNESLGKIS